MRIVREVIVAGVKVEEQVVKVYKSGDVYIINQGASGSGSNTINVVAGANLSGHRCVVVDSGHAVYADSSTPAHASRIAGITTGAISNGTNGQAQFAGEMDDNSFAFSLGPIYLGLNGLLTQVVPTSGFICEVAKALTATKILISISSPIII